jgi:Xaa-Pro aminopeptidase
MRRAAQIASQAHLRAMAVTRPGMHEYEIEAELVHSFMQNGARAPAYPCIVGGGANSCILHYTDNDAPLCDGDLLLIDAGAEYRNYASDVTRTFPVNGRFTPEQRAIYEIVLEAQLAAIAAVRPGGAWNEPHDAAVEVITKGLIDVGILKGRWRTLLKDEAYRPYYMHRTGHWLGMDVHDVGDYKVGDGWRTFEPGMVTTVEPGLYLASHLKGLARRWWDIGIRIEDDVLVTADGHEVLSAGAPKTIAEIETTMRQARAA